MIDQLRIGDKYSCDEFEASVRERKNNKPKKKVIKETVPFSNKTYDFSAMDGEVYWEERELEYVFEIIAATTEELEVKKKAFVSWVMNVMDEEIHDPYIEGYHFIGTFSDIDDDDSEFEKSTITVKFTAYPYMIANSPKEITINLPMGETEVEIMNESSHRVTPTITANASVIIKAGDSTYSISEGTFTDEDFKLEAGKNVYSMVSTGGTISFVFTEEVF